MKLNEKIELIQSSSSKEILNGGGHNGTPLLKYVFEIHEEVFGMPCKTCSSLLPRYIAKIQNINLKKEIMSQKDRKYRMKSGSVIHVRGTNEYYSDLNITDEVAEKLLKVNPNRSVLFSKIPKGALERLEKEAAKEAKAAEEAAKPAPQPEKLEDKQTEAPAEAEAPAEEVEVNEAEEVEAETPAQEEAAEEAEKADSELNMNELREKYPHIKARSKEEFLRELNA